MSTTDIRGNLSLQLQQTTMALTSATTSVQACTWSGHCLGAPCTSFDDCDNDWICVSNVCSPCCATGDNSPTPSATPGPTTSTSATSSHKLSTGAAVGIGVGIVVLLAIVAGITAWLWHVRRRPKSEDAPSPTEPQTYPSDPLPEDDRKHLLTFKHRSELSAPSKPVEPDSVELVELEGDQGKSPPDPNNDNRKHPIAISEQTTRSPQFRNTEYSLSPEGETPVRGNMTFSPVSDLQSDPTFARPNRWQAGRGEVG